MLATPQRHHLQLNGIRVHCLEHAGDGPPLLMLHSLSGNAHLFDGLVAAGLAPAFRLLIPDMRGRGKTQSPLSGYSLEDGCADILALLDHFELEQVALCGHSFGGMLGMYFAGHYPERVSRLIMLDAAAEMHSAAPMMIAAVGARLDMVYPSLAVYRQMMKLAPFVTPWYDEMEGFVAADLQQLASGVLTTSSRGLTSTTAAMHIYGVSTRGWRDHATLVPQPALLIQAPEPFMMGMPMLPEHKAVETVKLMKQARLAHAAGNHFTMLFGPGAHDITSAVTAFLRE